MAFDICLHFTGHWNMLIYCSPNWNRDAFPIIICISYLRVILRKLDSKTFCMDPSCLSTKQSRIKSAQEKQIKRRGEWETAVFFFKRNPEWRSANMPLEGIARTERQAPAVRAILKQTPSPARGLSLGLWKWEWDWTVQPCRKYSRSTFFPRTLQMPQIGPSVRWEEKGGGFS